MTVTSVYASPLGPLLLAAEGDALTGLWLPGQKYYAAGLAENASEDPSAAPICLAARWLDDYFAGLKPEARALRLSPRGTEFRMLVEASWGSSDK